VPAKQNGDFLENEMCGDCLNESAYVASARSLAAQTRNVFSKPAYLFEWFRYSVTDNDLSSNSRFRF
jgi:hypothetical protein